MTDIEVWVARAVIGALVTGAVIALARMRALERNQAVLTKTVGRLEKQDTGAGAVQELRICIAENYVRREDYVPQMSGINAKLDSIGAMVARLDERSRGERA